METTDRRGKLSPVDAVQSSTPFRTEWRNDMDVSTWLKIKVARVLGRLLFAVLRRCDVEEMEVINTAHGEVLMEFPLKKTSGVYAEPQFDPLWVLAMELDEADQYAYCPPSAEMKAVNAAIAAVPEVYAASLNSTLAWTLYTRLYLC
jgi:hypothetical protein